MKPRMGKMDIDYDVLHDAFFKFQTKPRMNNFGDIYYEGKENDIRSKNFKPGKLSDSLRVNNLIFRKSRFQTKYILNID